LWQVILALLSLGERAKMTVGNQSLPLASALGCALLVVGAISGANQSCGEGGIRTREGVHGTLLSFTDWPDEPLWHLSKAKGQPLLLDDGLAFSFHYNTSIIKKEYNVKRKMLALYNFFVISS
jgi:hypothetical protein